MVFDSYGFKCPLASMAGLGAEQNLSTGELCYFLFAANGETFIRDERGNTK